MKTIVWCELGFTSCKYGVEKQYLFIYMKAKQDCSMLSTHQMKFGGEYYLITIRNTEEAVLWPEFC